MKMPARKKGKEHEKGESMIPDLDQKKNVHSHQKNAGLFSEIKMLFSLADTFRSSLS